MNPPPLAVVEQHVDVVGIVLRGEEIGIAVCVDVCGGHGVEGSSTRDHDRLSESSASISAEQVQLTALRAGRDRIESSIAIDVDQDDVVRTLAHRVAGLGGTVRGGRCGVVLACGVEHEDEQAWECGGEAHRGSQLSITRAALCSQSRSRYGSRASARQESKGTSRLHAPSWSAIRVGCGIIRARMMDATQANVILDASAVEGWAGVYVLGCIDRRVTVYSQQVRALNLAAALLASARVEANDKVVVVGAGAAGLTCAAGLRKHGADVIVLEARREILPLFRGNSTRWLHPGVYDWPLDAWNRSRAGLPLLDWEHGSVDSVRKQLEDSWAAVRNGIVVQHGVRDVRLGLKEELARNVTWTPNGRQRDATVILAVGFGLEATSLPTERRYWEGDDIDSPRVDDVVREWLISGCGDGALTDLFRLCLRDFLHHQMLHDFTSDPQMERIRDEIRRIETDAKIQDDPQKLHDAYADLDAPWVLGAMRARARSDTRVTLAAPTADFLTRGASPLNRFLAGQLFQAGMFELLPCRLTGARQNGARVAARFADETVRKFDRVVRRHGPDSALIRSFPLIAKAVEADWAQRRSKPTLMDQTRERLWTEGAFGPEVRNVVEEPNDPSSREQHGTSRKGEVMDQRRPVGDPNTVDTRIAAAYEFRETRKIAGEDTKEIEAEILDLRRQQRRGSTLPPRDFLSNGRFRIIEMIGQGGFGTVWKAYDKIEQELVAVKILHQHLMNNPVQRKRFIRGARKIEKLRHPNIIRVLTVETEENGLCYFAMEYVAGGDLDRAVREKVLHVDQSLVVVEAIAGALEVVHEYGLVHRDIKPQNILLRVDGTPLLCDFDLVQAQNTTGGTRSGALGTMIYAAPEQNEDASCVDHRADIYSLGMTAVFCIYGDRLPSIAMYQRHDFLRALPCTHALHEVLLQAVDLRPEGRFDSMARFRAELAIARRRVNPSEKPSDPNLDQEIQIWPRHSWREGILDALVRWFRDPGTALVLLRKAGYPIENMPVFRVPSIFWSEIVRAASFIILRNIVSEASDTFPYNPEFARFHRAAKTENRAISELINILHDEKRALSLARRAGFSIAHIPEFFMSYTFWEQLTETARHGALPDGVRSLIECAADEYPDNRIFAEYLAEAACFRLH